MNRPHLTFQSQKLIPTGLGILQFYMRSRSALTVPSGNATAGSKKNTVFWVRKHPCLFFSAGKCYKQKRVRLEYEMGTMDDIAID